MECVRRLALASVVGIVDAGSAVSALLGVLICLGFNFVFIRWEPFKAKEDSDLGVLLSYALIFFFLSALLIKVDIVPDGKSEQQLFGIILIMLLGSGPITIVLQLSKGKIASWLRVCGDLVYTSGDAKDGEQDGSKDDQEGVVQQAGRVQHVKQAPRPVQGGEVELGALHSIHRGDEGTMESRKTGAAGEVAGPRQTRTGSLAALSMRNASFVQKLAGIPAAVRARGSSSAGMRGRTESVVDTGVAVADTWTEEAQGPSAEAQHERRRSDHLIRSSQSFKPSTNPLARTIRLSSTAPAAKETTLPQGWTEHVDETTGKAYFVSDSGETTWARPPLAITEATSAPHGSDSVGEVGDAPSQRYSSEVVDL